MADPTPVPKGLGWEAWSLAVVVVAAFCLGVLALVGGGGIPDGDDASLPAAEAPDLDPARVALGLGASAALLAVAAGVVATTEWSDPVVSDRDTSMTAGAGITP